MVKNNNPPGPLGLGLGLGSRLIPTPPFRSVPPSAPQFGLTGWDSASTVNMYLSQLTPNGPYLNAKSGPFLQTIGGNVGTDQGTCVSPDFAQTNASIYYEILWQNIGSDLAAIGMGIAKMGSLQNTLTIEQKAARYGGLAANGTGGIILRPDGLVMVDGNTTTFGAFPQDAGDVVGFFLGISENFAAMDVVILGAEVREAGTFFLPKTLDTPVVPVVVYDSATSPNILCTANFGYSGFNSFLGTAIFSRDSFDGVTMGWPSSPQ